MGSHIATSTQCLSQMKQDPLLSCEGKSKEGKKGENYLLLIGPLNVGSNLLGSPEKERFAH